ncbi:unnamed protein product [Callosobruchus maculatus]|uniref:Uncharacterized protein n=1 Tax=Callosobruchus maculatus TaxID=64391 RepID=A0A653BIM6_CALMS|nr:unnamed protein product [Callosobruchus maculatus]
MPKPLLPGPRTTRGRFPPAVNDREVQATVQKEAFQRLPSTLESGEQVPGSSDRGTERRQGKVHTLPRRPRCRL